MEYINVKDSALILKISIQKLLNTSSNTYQELKINGIIIKSTLEPILEVYANVDFVRNRN